MLIELIQIVPKEKLILIHTLPRGENKATRYTQMDIVGSLQDKARENRFASIMPFNALPNRHKMEARHLFGHSDLLQKKFIHYEPAVRKIIHNLIVDYLFSLLDFSK